MKISVVLSTYNGELYIIEQLNSIMYQNKKADEVLIFDDCSTDETVHIIEKYIEKNNLSQWKLFVNDKNKGWKRNFMEGIWNASGDLIFPCDQDDIWKPQKLECMVKIMEENPQIMVLTSNYEAFYDSGKRVCGPERDDGELIKQPLSNNVFNIRYPGCTYCIRQTFVEISKKYWQEDFPHDALFWRMGMFSDSLYSYRGSLIQWRKHNDSTFTIESAESKTVDKKRQWLEYGLRVIDSLDDFVKNYSDVCEIEKEKILISTKRWLEKRIEFYNTRSIIDWIKILKYLSYYDRFRQYIGDLYLVKIKK